MSNTQYTIRGVPGELDRVLRAEAHQRGKSLNAVIIEALQTAKMPAGPPYTDLDWFVGSGGFDQAETDALEWLDSLPSDLPA